MSNTLTHYGILGMKWGVRRYQNEDGTLTSAGKKRYGDDGKHIKEEGKVERTTDTKKVAKGMAVGAAVVAGTVLTAYLVKKYGNKNISDMAATAEAGKVTLEKVLANTATASAPISQVSAPKVEPQKLIEQAAKSIPTTSIPRPRADIPQTYDFGSLMKQNQALLEKMYAELA